MVFVVLGTLFINQSYTYLQTRNRLFRNSLFFALFVLLPYFTTLVALSTSGLDISKAHNPITVFLLVVLANTVIQNFKEKVSLLK